MSTTVLGVNGLRALSGQHLGKSHWITVSQQRINLFAEATDDWHWAHVDEQRAAVGPFHGTIAHGFCTLSLLIPLMRDILDVRDVRIALNYGLNKVRFPAPVVVGAQLRLDLAVSAVVDGDNDGVQVAFRSVIESDQAAKPACVAEWLLRYYPNVGDVDLAGRPPG